MKSAVASVSWRRVWCTLASSLVVLLSAVVAGPAHAALLVPEPAHVERPASGAGPLLILLTGADGAPNHLLQAQAFGREGWVVVVVDSNAVMSDPPALLAELARRALARPEVRSPKAAVVGYSLGGWLVIAHANRMPEHFSAAVAFYPSTFRAGEPKAFLASPPVQVPTLMLAGVKDTYMGCCLIDRARAMLATGRLPEIAAPIELVEYPEADHGFVLPAFPRVFRPDDAADAVRRAADFLKASSAKP